MTATLRRRLVAVEEVAERRQAQRYADRYGLDADELLAGAQQIDAEYQRLRLCGHSVQEAWREIQEQVAAMVGKSVGELDAEWRRWCPFG